MHQTCNFNTPINELYVTRDARKLQSNTALGYDNRLPRRTFSPACPLTSLHMAIHGFAFWKFAKPAHEHHLQALKALASLVSVNETKTL